MNNFSKFCWRTHCLISATHNFSAKTKTNCFFFICVCSLVSWCCLLSWTEKLVRIITIWFIEFINLFVNFHSTGNFVLEVCTFRSLFDVQCSNITINSSYYWLQWIWWWIIIIICLKITFFLGMISIYTAERNERREMRIEHWASSTE